MGKRVGYGLWLVAIVTFVLGMATTLRPVMTVIVVGSLAVGSALLAPAIVVAYGVRAADREERNA